jgi:hypothetical protein
VKKVSLLVTLVAAGAAAIPSPAVASAANCRQDSAQATQCRTLATCRIIGTGIFNSASAQEAVAFARSCLDTEAEYERRTLSSGRADAFQRPRRLRVARNHFRPLYCEAVRRAGQRDQRICEIRATRRSGRRGSNAGGGGGGGDTRTPSLTG